MSAINFFSERIPFVLPETNQTRQWIESVLKDSQSTARTINFVFTSDDHLLEINKQYLQHDYFTDIITFPYSTIPEALEADIFISIDRVGENAENLAIPFMDELHRVLVHGILHVLGHMDNTTAQKNGMRKIENHYLALRQFTV